MFRSVLLSLAFVETRYLYSVSDHREVKNQKVYLKAGGIFFSGLLFGDAKNRKRKDNADAQSSAENARRFLDRKGQTLVYFSQFSIFDCCGACYSTRREGFLEQQAEDLVSGRGRIDGAEAEMARTIVYTVTGTEMGTQRRLLVWTHAYTSRRSL